MRTIRLAVLPAALGIGLSGCFGYAIVRPGEITMPSYEPRAVAVPPECEALLARAATPGALGQLSESDARTVSFCQHQQLIRAQEEETAARKLEAHSSAARFALQAATVVIGTTVALLAWVF